MYSAPEMEKRKRLRSHVEASLRKTSEWGVDDCSRWAGIWVEAERGIDLGLPAYASREEAMVLVDTAGGLSALWASIADRAGLEETKDPQYGDVGVMETRNFGEVGFIMSDFGMCLWRGESGVLGLRSKSIVRAWTV